MKVEDFAIASANIVITPGLAQRLTGSSLDPLLSEGYGMDPYPVPFSENWVSGVMGARRSPLAELAEGRGADRDERLSFACDGFVEIAANGRSAG